MFIALMMMIVIALLVVTTTRSYNTEQRISTNDADRKLVATLAEATLCEGENQIFDIEGKKTNFTRECKDGFCATPNMKSNSEAIKETATEDARKKKYGENQSLCIDANGKEYFLGKNSDAAKNPHYIVGYLGKTTEGRITYRIAAETQGRNIDTQVVLQSCVANE